MNVLNHIVLGILVLTLAACSQQSEKVSSISVKIAGLSSVNVSGGYVITGKSLKGKTFTHVLGTADSVTVDIPNDTWNILAIGWDGGTPFGGKIQCAYQTAVKLDGKATQVELKISNAKCFDGTVNDVPGVGGSPLQFGNTILNACRKPLASLAALEACDIASVDDVFKAASVARFKIKVRGDNKTDLSTGCYDTTTINSHRFPIIKPAFHFPLDVDNYLDASCSEDKKITANLKSENLRVSQQSSINYFHAFISDEEVCDIADKASINTIDGIGAGTGKTSFSPFAICRVEQWEDWQRTFDTTKANYVVSLLRDIDFGSKAKFGTIQGFHKCLNDGGTMFPLGHNVLSDATCTLTDGTSHISFKGRFNGNGKSIKNFRFRPPQNQEDTMDIIGLFASLEAGEVGQLKLVNPEVDGHDYVGAIAGQVLSTGIVRSVEVTNAHIEGENYTGGLIGQVFDTTSVVNDVHVKNTTVNGQSWLGGVVGESSSSITNASFSGKVKDDQGQYVGGIVGKGTNVSWAVSEGYITGMTHVGGIAGQVTGNVRTTRSTMAVSTSLNDSSLIMGGIAGEASSVQESMFTGSLSAEMVADGRKISELAGIVTTVDKSMINSSAFRDLTGGISMDTIVTRTPYSVTLVTVCINPSICDWTIPAGLDMPRLSWEQHECQAPANSASLSTQVASGRGNTLTNRIALCNLSQVEEIGFDAGGGVTPYLGKHYKLLQDISFPDNTANILVPGNFTGSLDGQNHWLHGWKNSPTVGSALFSNIDTLAVIQNLKLANISNKSTAAISNVAALSIYNNGTIQNIELRNIQIESGSVVGGLVAHNYKIISNVHGSTQVRANESVGGLVAQNYNTGEISGVSLRVNLDTLTSDLANAPENFGGVVGHNAGLIERVKIGGNISVSSSDASGNFAPSRIGGVVGTNSLIGMVRDIQVTEQLSLSYADKARFIGGVAGHSKGATNDIVSYASIEINSNGINKTDVSQIVGNLSYTTGGDQHGGIQNAYFTIGAHEYQNSASGITGTLSGGVCTYSTLDLSIPTSNYIFDWEPTSPNEHYWLEGHYDDTTKTLTYNSTAETCGMAGGINVYKTYADILRNMPASQATTGFSSILDYTNPANFQTVLDLHTRYINTGSEVGKPIWKYEDGEYELFFFDD